MASNQPTISALSRGLASSENWQDLVEWETDPLLQADTSFPDTSDYHGNFPGGCQASGSFAFDQLYSLPTLDQPSSFDYSVSAPPSAIEGPSSAGHAFSWLSTSPSFSTTATSPQVGQTDSLYGSFNAYESFPLAQSAESPLLEIEEEVLLHGSSSSNTIQTSPSNFLNPFLPSSRHAFNSLDVNSSQAIGGVDPPGRIEPILEYDHDGAIPIFQPSQTSYNNTPPFYPRSEDAQDRAQAIAIPQPTRGSASYNPGRAPSQWARDVPPVLSVSPEARRRPRNPTLSRSMSKSEPRRARNSLTTPSPTSNTFGWVSYQPNQQTHRLMPFGSEGSRGRRQRGRTKALTTEQRREAALMRVIKACSNCQRRKEKCDPGIPCRSCLEHYKGDLIHFPCRDRLLSNLSQAFLSDRFGWHPTTRALESFIEPNNFNIITSTTYTIPLHLGFGDVFHLPVHALQVSDPHALYHNHIIYSWPPTDSEGDLHTHAVLPAILTPEALSTLPDTLSAHLSLLVDNHFRAFPLYTSPLRILREIYIFYRSLHPNTPSSSLLHLSLKLLVLVHIGGDLTLPAPSTNATLAHVVDTTLCVPADTIPTPCFIRAQLGATMPALALSLMKQILVELEKLFLNREPGEWPLALAVLVTVLMTVESVHYHAAKLPYHHSFDRIETQHARNDREREREEERRSDEQGVKTLFAFYETCFVECRGRLMVDVEGEDGEKEKGGERPEDVFIGSVREAVERARKEGYLAEKARGEGEGEDMGFFFDRLVARLMVLHV